MTVTCIIDRKFILHCPVTGSEYVQGDQLVQNKLAPGTGLQIRLGF